MEKFYITTPIFYVNDKPHLGTAFTVIIADVLARWHRLKKEKVFFLTGTDEHGEKIEKAAKSAGKSTKEFVDSVVLQFKKAWEKLDISYDKFIRTTDPKHEEAVIRFVKLLWNNGDIYKGEYIGWYCVPDETFIADSEVKDEKCPNCGRPVERIKEEAYFFRLSRYKDRLLGFYEKNPDFVIPDFRGKEVINRVKAGLNDLDITRISTTWGIGFPFDKKHTIYVWLDALTNYISALDWPGGEKFDEFWPADLHIVGKDINWFHSVVWPAFLMSAGVSIPKSILVHGWWTVSGAKMSKSLKNIVDPSELTKTYSADGIRYFLLKEKSIWEDGDFSESALASAINGELVSGLGNLVARVTTIAEKFKGDIKGNDEIDEYMYKVCGFDLSSLIKKVDDCLCKTYRTDIALKDIMSAVGCLNKYITDKEPWKLASAELGNVLYNVLEPLRIISIILRSFLPETADSIFSQIGVEPQDLEKAKMEQHFTGKVKRGKNLFRLVEISV
ncbi:methionine--tRNA ligase [Candidatus Parvarchaeota archaeon]|nr:methionine--tRNA ligase [Candidatus Parvarchaeota archaeon]